MNQTRDYIPWDIAEANAIEEARSYATPKFELSKVEDRARCWFAHLLESYAGGPGLFYQTYDLDRTGMEDWIYRGRPLDQDTIKQLSRHKDEWDQLAAHDPFFAELSVLGGQNHAK